MKRMILLFFIAPAILFAQLAPINYQLEKNRLAKISDSTPLSNSILDIISEDGMIMLGTSRGLSISKDEGENWANYFQSETFGDEGIIALGYNEGIIWTTTGHSTEVEGGDELPEGSGIRYSTDGGENWTVIPQPVDDLGDSIITYGINTIRALPITVAINNISYDIAFTKNTVWIASFAGGLRKSFDNGETWERVVLPPDYLDSIKPTDTLDFSLQPVGGAFGPESYLNHRLFSVVGVDDTTLYAGTAGGINKSTDNGISWKKFTHQNQDDPISGNFVVALSHNEYDGSVWGATWKANDLNEFWGVSYTNNGGDSWVTTLPNEHAHNFGFKYFGDSPNYTDADIFTPTDNGIFRSSNMGQNWSQPSSISDDVTKVPIATNTFYSMDSEKSNDGSTNLWIGSDNGLAKLKEEDAYWVGEWRVYLASGKPNSPTETYAFPNPFSPNQEAVKIKYVLSSNADVTIRIMDFGMNLVRTLIQNANSEVTGVQIKFWDGKDENGNVVPNGVYFYRIDISSSDPLFGKIMVLK